MADSFNDADKIKKETEEALDGLEQKAEKSAKSILKKINDAVKKGLKVIGVAADEELDTAVQTANSRIVLESEALKEIEELKKNAASDDEARSRESIERAKAETLAQTENAKAVIERERELERQKYADMEILRKQYFTMGEEEWERYTDAIYEFCTKSVENMATDEKKYLLSVFKEVRSEIENDYESLLKTQGKMENKLKSYGGLYSDLSEKSTAKTYRFEDISLDGMKKNAQILANYDELLTNAKQRLYDVFPTSGVPDAVKEKNREHIKNFFSELADMSVEEGGMFALYLATIPTEEAEEYLKQWAANQELAEAISKKLYSDDQAELFDESAKKMSNAFEESLEKHFGSVPSGFYNRGVLAAQGFGDGFKSEIEKTLSGISINMDNIFTGGAVSKASALPTNVVNNSSYNIYNAQPENTVLEIYKYDAMKRMLVGD